MGDQNEQIEGQGSNDGMGSEFKKMFRMDEVEQATPETVVEPVTSEELVDSSAQNLVDESGDAEEEDTPETRYNNLLSLFNEQSARLLEMQSQLRTPVREVEPTYAPERSLVSQPAQAVEFSVSDRDLEQALIEDDPAAMKRVLVGLIEHVKNIVSSSTSGMQETVRERVLRDIPELTNKVAVEQVKLHMAIAEFYRENSDLLPHRASVGVVMNEVVAKEPNLSLADAFQKTESEVRRRLGLKKSVLDREAAGGRGQPAFAKKSGSRKPGAPVLTGLKSEISSMMRAK
jgi:hypothetical protein